MWVPKWVRAYHMHEGHAEPAIEQQSSELVGKLSLLADQLEEAVKKKEQELGNGNGD